MPLEAIAYHLPRLKTIVVLPSSDGPGKKDGTWRDFSAFQSLVLHLTSGSEQPVVSGPPVAWPNGLDFESPKNLVTALNRVYDELHRNKTEDRDIMTDITGGQKVPGVAGAVAALGAHRRIQYVSTRDLTVRSYDITYEAAIQAP